MSHRTRIAALERRFAPADATPMLIHITGGLPDAEPVLATVGDQELEHEADETLRAFEERVLVRRGQLDSESLSSAGFQTINTKLVGNLLDSDYPVTALDFNIVSVERRLPHYPNAQALVPSREHWCRIEGESG